jgi:hypothetical protein
VFSRFFVVSGEPFSVCARYAGWGFKQAFAVRIIAGPPDKCSYSLLGLSLSRATGIKQFL